MRARVKDYFACAPSILVGVFLALFSWSVANAEEVDLELVLALDASGSINEREFLLQLEGTARAFEAPQVQHAITSGPIGRIAVSVLIWSDATFPKIKSDWYVLNSVETAQDFASIVRNFLSTTQRTPGPSAGGTGIGAGIEVALRMIETNDHVGARRIIDVSGDGVETDPRTNSVIRLPQARALAEARGVLINGLPIQTVEHPFLDEYFVEHVISGPGAFVVTAFGFNDFARAIREKLLSEISSRIAERPQSKPKGLTVLAGYKR